MQRLGLCLCALLLLLTSCSLIETEDAEPPMSAQQRALITEQISPELITVHNQLGIRLHQLLWESRDPDNVLFSPYSIGTALTMAYAGSSGTTAEEMNEALGLGKLQLLDLHASSERLIRLLSSPGSGVQVNTANAIWINDGYTIKESYLKTITDSYHTEAHSLDFGQKNALKKINQWVSKHTKGNIDPMLDNPVPADTVSLLTNAIYFKGAWQQPFHENNTQEASFSLLDGTIAKVNMMSQGGSFHYAESSQWQAVRLPYGDEAQLNMLIILPKSSSSIHELHRSIWEDLTVWQQPFEQKQGQVQLPRFTLEENVQLKELLIQLGMKQAFTVQADFSGITDSPLQISDVQHKTFMKVNEYGTEAAAATSVGLAGSAPPDKPFQMTIDRPFFFAIEDTLSHTWLFLGTVVKPEEQLR